jgi:hypothetical protein
LRSGPPFFARPGEGISKNKRCFGFPFEPAFLLASSVVAVVLVAVVLVAGALPRIAVVDRIVAAILMVAPLILVVPGRFSVALVLARLLAENAAEVAEVAEAGGRVSVRGGGWGDARAGDADGCKGGAARQCADHDRAANTTHQLYSLT